MPQLYHLLPKSGATIVLYLSALVFTEQYESTTFELTFEILKVGYFKKGKETS